MNGIQGDDHITGFQVSDRLRAGFRRPVLTASRFKDYLKSGDGLSIEEGAQVSQLKED